jgi:hypothetical protein
MPFDSLACVRPGILGIAVLAAFACGQPTSGDDGSTGASGSEESVSASETGAPATQAEPNSTSTGEPASTSGEPDTTGDTGTSGSSSADDSSTGYVNTCTLEHWSCALAGALDDEVADCGIVDVPDDVTKWQAAHDCVLAAMAEQRAFKLITYLEDSYPILGEAYVAQVNRPYMPWKLLLDAESSCPLCPPEVLDFNCNIAAKPDCIVEPGNVCLICDDDNTGWSQLCPPI